MRHTTTAEAGQARRPEAPHTYYHYPAIKAPAWGWEVVLHFFLGGIAAGAHLVATLAHLFGRPEDRPVSRVGRYLALVTATTSALLLSAGLGRPDRWRHMLRILKTRSPMSTGSWGLAGLGVFAGFGALRQAIEDGLVSRDSLVARLAGRIPLAAPGVLGTLSAFFAGSYTGVLLSFTNTPLWAKNRFLMGPLYLTSALSTGLAAISAVLAATGEIPRRTRRWLGLAEDAAGLAEAGLAAGTVATLGQLRRPLTRRRYALPFWLGSLGLGTVAPFLLRRNLGEAPEREARARLVAAGLSVLVGGLILRWVTVLAGRQSARDPEEYLGFTRGG